MCKLLNIAVQGVYPLICQDMKGDRSFYEKENIVLVKDYLKEKNKLILPMRIVVKYEDKEIFLGPNLTKIPKRCLQRYHLQSEEFKDSYVITKEVIQSNDRVVECREEIQLFNAEELVDILNEDELIEDMDSTLNNTEEINSMTTNSSQLFNAEELVDILNEDELIEDMDSTLNNTEEINSMTTNSSQESQFEEDFVNDHTSLLSETFNRDQLYRNQNEIQVEGSSTQITVNSSEIEMMSTCYEENADNSINDVEDNSEALVDNSQISNIIIDNTENSNHNGTNSNLNNNEATEEHSDSNNILHDNAEENVDVPNDINTSATDESINQEEPYFDEDNTNDLPKQKMIFMNMFLHSEKWKCEDIRNLIHISKSQFLDFVKAVRPHLEKLTGKAKLSVYSLAFLFRLKLAKNKSFRELATLFVVSHITVRMVYRKVLHIVYRYHTAIPNILDGPDAVEKLFDDAATATDPFFMELIKPFKDPSGN